MVLKDKRKLKIAKVKKLLQCKEYAYNYSLYMVWHTHDNLYFVNVKMIKIIANFKVGIIVYIMIGLKEIANKLQRQRK